MPPFTFEKFTHAGGSFAPMISVRKDRALGISQGALRKFGLMEGDWYVVLFFDRSNNAIGIKPTEDPNEEGAVKLVKRLATGKNGQSSLSGSVSARSFLEFYGIPTPETTSYRAERDEESGIIVIRLNCPEVESKE
jgi:hypothetical protein